MKISVIIPIFNVEPYLKKCLDSVVNQTYTNLEIILINDGSTDNSLSIIREYEKADNRIIVIDQPNEGVSSARNAGLDIMTGDYLSFVDPDDYIDTDSFEKVMLLMNSLENIDMIGFPSYRVYEDGTIHPNYLFTDSFIREYNSTTHSEEILCGISPFGVWAKVFKSSIFQDIRFPKGEIYEDKWIFPEMDRKLKIIGFSELGKYYYYCRRNGSIMRTVTLSNIKKRLKVMRFFLDYIYFETNPSIAKTVAFFECAFIQGTIEEYSNLNFRKRFLFHYYLLKFILKGKTLYHNSAPLKYYIRLFLVKLTNSFLKVCKMCGIYEILRRFWKLITRKNKN